MSIENSLEKISLALDAIALALQPTPTPPPPIVPPALQPAAPPPPPPPIVPPALQPAAPAYEDVYAEFFKLLNATRDAQGMPAAREVARRILAEHTGGLPISRESLPEASYSAMLATIRHG